MVARSRAAVRTGRRRSEGASAVEFALISTILFTLVFGIIQYGVYFWSIQAGTAAARETVRQSAVGKLTCAQLDSSTQGQVPDSTANAQRTMYASATSGTPSGAASVGGDVKVTVVFDVPLNLGLFPLPASGTITQEARARVEATSIALTSCS